MKRILAVLLAILTMAAMSAPAMAQTVTPTPKAPISIVRNRVSAPANKTAATVKTAARSYRGVVGASNTIRRCVTEDCIGCGLAGCIGLQTDKYCTTANCTGCGLLDCPRIQNSDNRCVLQNCPGCGLTGCVGYASAGTGAGHHGGRGLGGHGRGRGCR